MFIHGILIYAMHLPSLWRLYVHSFTWRPSLICVTPIDLRKVPHPDLHRRQAFLNLKLLLAALQRVEMMGILPLDPSTVSEKVDLFSKLDETVKRGVGDLILAAMTALYKQHSALVPSPAQSPYFYTTDPARQVEIQAIKTRAHALATFTGRIQYRLPSDITSRLLQFQALMS